MLRRLAILLSCCCALVLGITSCAAGGPDDQSDPVPPATSNAGQLAQAGCAELGNGSAAAATPAATGADVVLTVTIRPSGGAAIPVRLDMAALDAMPQVQCSVDDRLAEGRQVTFSGVLLSTLLDEIGAHPESILHTAALNDYAVDLPVSDIREVPVLLATRADGAPMSVAHYGPLRIIYPTTGFDLDPTVYDPRRIWQLSSIDVQ